MFKKHIEELLSYVETVDVDINLIDKPKDRSIADFCYPCFSLAKKLRKSPAEIAKEISIEINWRRDQLENFPAPKNVLLDVVSQIRNEWGFVNISLDPQYVILNVVREVLKIWNDKDSNLFIKQKRNWKSILLEWRSPNTHKMLHVWHLRNALVSHAMSEILDFAWYNVFRTAYGGDIWAHVAKWIWYVKNFTDWSYPTDPELFTIWSWDIYQQATSKVDENVKEYKKQIHETQRLLENWDHDLVKFWKSTRELSISWLKSAFKELWCEIDRFYRESDVEQPWIELVKKYEQDESIPQIRMSEWAIIADLEEFDLWVFLLLKSNGTSLYSTKDVALAFMKQDEYEFDISLYVVATEQNLHFKQLFQTLELIWVNVSKLHHMWYELVELPDWKMSSRKWTIIPYHARRDNAITRANDLIAHRDVDKKEIVAKSVAYAALKFSMLLQDTYKKIRLDMNTALSFEWETWPYLQYTHARASSILNKWNRKTIFKEHEELPGNLIYWGNMYSQEEKLLAYRLRDFPYIIQKSAREYKPSLVARYVLDLASDFNSYYQWTQIIVEWDDKLTQARLSLVASVQQVLHNGLQLLWIEAPEKM